MTDSPPPTLSLFLFASLPHVLIRYYTFRYAAEVAQLAWLV